MQRYLVKQLPNELDENEFLLKNVTFKNLWEISCSIDYLEITTADTSSKKSFY